MAPLAVSTADGKVNRYPVHKGVTFSHGERSHWRFAAFESDNLYATPNTGFLEIVATVIAAPGEI
jgi:hypothetical protein